MILVRDVFQLKFGQARPALAAWKEGQQVMKDAMKGHSPRLLTDLIGTYYTLVLEMTFNDLAEFEKMGKAIMADDNWRAWYQKMIPFVESGHREVFNVVE